MSQAPLTCYRISRMYNMNVAKVYAAMKRLAGLGLVAPSRGRRGTEYRLRDEDLRRLALKFSGRVVTYEAWSSAKARRERFRSGLSLAPAPQLGKARGLMTAKPTRLPGELDNLALLARVKFDGKYHRRPDGLYDTVQ